MFHRNNHHLLLIIILVGSVFVTESFVVLHQQQHHHHNVLQVDTNPRGVMTLFAEAETDSNCQSSSSSSKSSNNNNNDIVLPAFPAAADPRYINEGPVGQGDFIVTRTGEPQAEELTNENILKIVKMQCTDLEVNTLVWKCLGYRFENGEWNSAKCFPKWREKYPTPPDLLGMQRIYTKEIDQISLRSNQALVRSIPLEHKQQLRKHLKPMGWNGYTLKELVPNKTRRAQCANWLLFYRDELFGYTLEELREKRRRKQEKEEEEKQNKEEEEEWRPPISEVF